MLQNETKPEPFGSGFISLVDDIGLDLIMELPPSSWWQADVHRTSAFKWVRVLSLIPYQNKKPTPLGGLFILVDDIGLEPMTFRTSSLVIEICEKCP